MINLSSERAAHDNIFTVPELFCILIIYLNHIHIYQLHVQRVQHICRAKNFKPNILGINSFKKKKFKVMHSHMKLL